MPKTQKTGKPLPLLALKIGSKIVDLNSIETQIHQPNTDIVCRLTPVRDRHDYHINRVNEMMGDGMGVFEALDRWLQSPRCQRLKASSFNTILAELKGALRRALGHRLDWDMALDARVNRFFRRYKRRVRKKARDTILTLPELGRLIALAPDRSSVMIEFLFYSGVRASELCGIRLRDVRTVDIEVVEITIRDGKTGSRKILVPARIVERARTIFHGRSLLFETAHGKEYRRQDVYNMVTTASTRYLGFRISPHDLRRTFITHAYDANPARIRALMRHTGNMDVQVFLEHYKVEKDAIRPGDYPEPPRLPRGPRPIGQTKAMRNELRKRLRLAEPG